MFLWFNTVEALELYLAQERSIISDRLSKTGSNLVHTPPHIKRHISALELNLMFLFNNCKNA
ncbi:MAG: hypothetical protein H6772_02415 [Pseudomonadales bacterium]|nr:hypothetical protein [Pseudomonadales bacterium]